MLKILDVSFSEIKKKKQQLVIMGLKNHFQSIDDKEERTEKQQFFSKSYLTSQMTC